jgi:hypothetical protein
MKKGCLVPIIQIGNDSFEISERDSEIIDMIIYFMRYLDKDQSTIHKLQNMFHQTQKPVTLSDFFQAIGESFVLNNEEGKKAINDTIAEIIKLFAETPVLADQKKQIEVINLPLSNTLSTALRHIFPNEIIDQKIQQERLDYVEDNEEEY